ncbi:MAG: hypothetical protein Tsb0034_27470 [Ekhidna sp.]
MKRYHLLLTILFLSIQTSAQYLKDDVQLIDSIKQQNISAIHSISTSFNPGGRDLYIDKDWKYGILLTDNDETIFFNGRINVARGYLECKVNNRIRKIASGRIKLVDLEGQTYIPVQSSDFESGGINTYLKVLSWGKISLVERYVVEVESRRGDSLNPDLTGTESLVVESELYYTKDFEVFEELKTNKRFIFELMTSRKSEVEKMIDINKWKFSSNRDITSIFNYYNSLN